MLLLSGCAGTEDSHPATVPVSGRVVLGGEAVGDALVVFYPVAPNVAAAQATTDGNGEFHLTSFEPADGAQPGKYVVVITKQRVENEMTPAESRAYFARTGTPPPLPTYQELLPKKYSSHETSDLAVEVQVGQESHFNFELRSGS